MTTLVHRISNVLFKICVSLLIGGVFLAFSVSAQETETIIGSSPINTATSTAQSDQIEFPQSAKKPYVIQRIPGGDLVVGDFVVGPGKVDLTILPGQSKVVTMMVTNRTGERRVFNVRTEDAKGSYDLETPITLLGNDRGPYSLRDYLQIPHVQFELDHNERALVPVTIAIPNDAEPGGLYGSVLIDTVTLESQGVDSENAVPQSAIVARIGTLFFITVPGDVLHEGSLTDFGTIADKSFFAAGPIDLGILFENTGSIHLAPYGEIRVTNMFGEEVGFLQLEPWFVLPQSQRLRELSFEREFLIGRYTATLQLNRSYDDVIDTETVTFWVLPWKILGIGFASVFLVVFVIRLFFRTFEFKRKEG